MFVYSGLPTLVDIMEESLKDIDYKPPTLEKYVIWMIWPCSIKSIVDCSCAELITDKSNVIHSRKIRQYLYIIISLQFNQKKTGQFL